MKLLILNGRPDNFHSIILDHVIAVFALPYAANGAIERLGITHFYIKVGESLA